jgi:hypothetical protein
MLKIKLPTAKATEGGPQLDKRRRSAAGAGRAESVEVCALCRSAAALALLPSRGRRLRRRACPMATKFNPATTCSRLRRTEMIGRRLCRADKHQYSCPPRPMTITTQISRPSRLAELMAPIIITMMSRARAGGAVSSP